MRHFWIAATAAFAVLGPVGSAHAVSDGTTSCPTVRDHNQFLKKVMRFGVVSGGDYRASRVSDRAMARLGEARACMKRTDRAKYRLMRGAYEKRVANWRFHRQIDAATPYGEWAIPGYVVACESGGSYTVYNKTGSGASGAYQIMPSTWAAYGGTRYAGAAASAPPWAQHLVAGRILAGQGPGAWTCW